jgi:putative methyltransferase (TIGR04325 family)
MRRILKSIPFVALTYKYWQKKKYDQKFATDCYGCFRGIFNSFEEAIESAPQTKTIGYNNPDLANEYKQNFGHEIGAPQTAKSYDYPVMFWLKTIIENFDDVNKDIKVFDFGGNVGTHFYTYQKYLHYPVNLAWEICDFPEIIKAGRELADQKLIEVNNQNLRFTSDFNQASGKDIFIASGSIQYVQDISDSISNLSVKPQHLLINRIPLHDRYQFVTLQNGGQVFYPQYVFNKTNFIDTLQNIGYELADSWENPGDNCIIPFHMEYTMYNYHGLYFKSRST